MNQKTHSNDFLPDVKHIIAIGAGKGGVGKSTISVNLAIGLLRGGAKVGLLDGDIYGPSIPRLLGLGGQQPATTDDERFDPLVAFGIKVMTIGSLVDNERPLMWRGPMAHNAFSQLAMQTNWGELDYLIVDLPPGTGDVPLSVTQMFPLRGAIVVCTPQDVAIDDAIRAVNMFGQLKVPLLGLVENMSYFVGDDGKEYDIFGRGGTTKLASKLNAPLLGTIPISMELRVNCDTGAPLANFEADTALGTELTAMTENVVTQAEQLDAENNGNRPTLNVT